MPDAGSTRVPLVSVIVLAGNEESQLERAVRSVLAQSYPPDGIEVIVAVGRSGGGTAGIAERLAAENPRVTAVFAGSPDPRRVFAAGFAAARGELISRLDAHARIEPDHIATGVAALERTGAHSVGTRGTCVDGTPTAEAISIAMASRLGAGCTAFDLLRNGEDGSYLRARRAGAPLTLTPDLTVRHTAPPSLRALWRQSTGWGSSRAATPAEHPRPCALRQLVPPVLVAALAAGVACQASPRLRRLGRLVTLGSLGGVAACGSAAAVAAGRPRLAPTTAAALATLHIGHGTGFWIELLGRAVGRPPLDVQLDTTPVEDPLPVSVIMPVRNEEDQLERAVRSVLDQDYPHRAIEVIVAVGPSDDATRAIADGLAAADPRVRVIDNPDGSRQRGFNLGLEASKHPLVSRLDGHSFFAPGFLNAAVRALARTGADGVGGRVTFVGDGGFGTATALAMESRIGSGPATFRVGSREQAADTLMFGVYHRELFDRVGGYDPNLDINEDDEWHHRALQAGARFVFTPTMAFTHVARDEPARLFSQYWAWGEFRVETIAKHRAPYAGRHLVPPAAVAALAIDTLARTAARRPPRLLPLYAASVLAGAALIAARAGRPHLGPATGLATATMHIAYGSGFWWGIARRTGRRVVAGAAVRRPRTSRKQ